MASAQRGIFEEESIHHHYLEYSFDTGTASETANSALRDALSAAREAGGASGTNIVVAFGADLWRRLAADAAPEELHPFETIEGRDGKKAPSTQRDVLFWVHGSGVDDNLDCALAIQGALANIGTLELDETGFKYHDSRDLIGFVDGTANPKGDARQETALVPEGAVGAGGSFVISQRWDHELDSFLALPVAEQERVVGRTKADSIELEGDAMPADSHVSRTDVKIDGVAQKIYRRSAPFGRVGQHGLYFLAFACAPSRFDIQLRRMYGDTEDGIRDHLTDYSKAVTGSYWFAPSEDALAAAFGVA